MITSSHALRSGAMSTPRYSSPAQMPARMVGACSPMPPVNTIVSTPFTVAVSAARCLRAVRQYRVMASRASDESVRFSTSRMSELIPDMPIEAPILA